MMFLIRAAFWIGLLVMLMPTDERVQSKVATTARDALERTLTFCDRHEKLCVAGADMWATFTKKAEFGGQLASGLIQDWMSKSNAESGATKASYDTPAPRQGTLAPRDLGPRWRGTEPRTGA